jgi:hypothetical protein
MGPADWISLGDWLGEFRALHESARSGKLSSKDVARYEQDREVLAKALLIAQRLTLKAGQTARQTLRVVLQLPVALGPKRQEATTLDLGLGGFAAMMPKPLKVLERIEFVLTLRDKESQVKGKVRVVSVQRKGKPYRVAFAFEELPRADAERVGLEVFDAALMTLPPR